MSDVLVAHAPPIVIKNKRVTSIDLLRGTVMIIMALDHVRDFFHYDAFLYDPGDLQQTSILLFFTRWITHYCAPVFVFLAGTSAYLYGHKRTRRQLSFFLLTRGLWLVLADMFIITLSTSFNPSYPYFNLQVIWAIGVSMIVLAGLVLMRKEIVLCIGLVLVAGHNLLDGWHAPPGTPLEVIWSILHEPRDFTFGGQRVFIRYPVLPWIGIMAVGYYYGSLFTPDYDAKKRIMRLLWSGWTAIGLFIILRAGNIYGDAAHWSTQHNASFLVLSFMNVTKYPPSLLYTLMTLGPAFFFLVFTERYAPSWSFKIALFGRVPFFYYVVHFFLIHLLATIGAMLLGYNWQVMVLTDRVNRTPVLKGYGFNLLTVYSIWITLILILYPLCTWFDRYKRANQTTKKWLSYL